MLAVTVQPNLPPARIPYGDLRLGVLVARAAYPNNPCNGHEQVTTSSTPPAWTRPLRRKDSDLLGAANLAGQRCLIWVRKGFTRSLTCKLVMHEDGHWDGLADDEAGFPAMQTGIKLVGDDGAPPDAYGYPVAPCEVPGS